MVNLIHQLVFISSACWVSKGTEISNPLNGKHLRVLAMEFPVTLKTTRNSTGYVIDCYGVLCDFIPVISKSLNFSYSFLPVRETLAENLATGGGGIYFLIRDEADYFLSTSYGTPYRNQVVDIPTFWFIGPTNFIVPYPTTKANIFATIKTFTLDVWITIMSSIIAIIIYLRFTSLDVFQKMRSPRSVLVQTQTRIRAINNNTHRMTDFVFGTLLSQGQHCYSKWLVVRLAAGAWCLGCFFIVQIYSTTLTSHLMAPYQKPIANNMHELANNPNLAVVMDFGFNFHLQIKNLHFGDYKKLYDKVIKDSHLLCNSTEVCLKKVREDGNVAYAAPIDSILAIIENDLKTSETCRYYKLKEEVLSTAAFTFLQKKSPYTERMSIEMLRLHQAGLFERWRANHHVSNPERQHCLELDSGRRDGKLKRLSLANLSSAFVILGIGCGMSLLVFLLERLFHRSP